MNYLAHAVLSGGDYEVMAGNLLADQMKGAIPEDLPSRVALGVRLHRFLDAYTDNHESFKRSRARLDGRFGHYSGIVVDVVYDHILANHMDVYTHQSLSEFVEWADNGYSSCKKVIPQRFSPRWTGLMWLSEYAEEDGIERAFRRIVSRSRRSVSFADVFSIIRPELAHLEGDFAEFFPGASVVHRDFLEEAGVSPQHP